MNNKLDAISCWRARTSPSNPRCIRGAL